jgi:regulator of protease activity HflC (stomatin/prohibitin superfamily)
VEISEKGKKVSQMDKTDWKIIAWCIVAIIFVFAFILFKPFYSVPAGYKGVHLRFQGINRISEEGFNWKIPIVDSIKLMETRVIKYVITTESTSKDIQGVPVEVAINYKLGVDVETVYRNLGFEYQNRVIDPTIKESCKVVMAQYDAEDLVKKRDEVKNKIEEIIIERLKKYDLIVMDIALTDIDFSDEYNKAIEDKVVKQQELLATEFEEEKQVVKAQKYKNATITRAEGDAQAYKLTKVELTEDVLLREYIRKWDGKLPLVYGAQGNMLFEMDILKKTMPNQQYFFNSTPEQEGD